jgi:sugar phosphate isomerase/epimerase
MHLGLVTYNVARDWNLDTILEVCKKADIEGVEFRTGHAHGVEPVLNASERLSIRKKCHDAGLLQLSLGTDCEFHSSDSAEVNRNIERCKQFIALAHDIGAIGVKVRPNGVVSNEPLEKSWEQIGSALAKCGQAGSNAGVEIWLEVHGDPTSKPEYIREIMQQCCHPNVGITWNSNSADVQNGSIQESFDLLSSHIRCCHITELWNKYPWKELFTQLKSIKYNRFMLCEIGHPVCSEDAETFLLCYHRLWKELQQ